MFAASTRRVKAAVLIKNFYGSYGGLVVYQDKGSPIF